MEEPLFVLGGDRRGQVESRLQTQWRAQVHPKSGDFRYGLGAFVEDNDGGLGFAAVARAFERAKQRLVTEVFCGGAHMRA